MMLECRPGYYTTNVAIPAAIITYLCFISYTTRADGTLVEAGDRLQIVLTLLLTAVTFKNQVASLIPRISYFTMLDKYVFFCSIVACVVVLENVLFPVVIKFFSEENNWQEKSLLWFSVGLFTLINGVWWILIVLFVKARKRASKVLIRVHEAIRVVAAPGIPAQHREALLHEYLDSCNYQKWEIPKICTAESGYLHVQVPEDEPQRTKNIEKRQKLHELTRHKMEGKLDMLKMMYTKLNPTGSPLRTAKPQETFETGRAQPLRLSGHTTGARKRTRTQTPYHLMS
ncbi:hypothetical protein V7S43_000268 [Phytophthora oleae]|uniref:Neurotransmitter-gated ion-channel transmembrane domain-containing protein n=1 Tax=Phytophthora oleae TaxID=2107226 RepID=A0ABD3G5A4_9STRA